MNPHIQVAFDEVRLRTVADVRVRINDICTAILAEIEGGTFVEGPHRAAAKGAVIALRERLLERGALT